MVVSKEVALKAIKAYRRGRKKNDAKSFLLTRADLDAMLATNPTAGIRVYFGKDEAGKFFPVALPENAPSAPHAAKAVAHPAEEVFYGSYPICPPMCRQTPSDLD